jgi:hypothetical protein
VQSNVQLAIAAGHLAARTAAGACAATAEAGIQNSVHHHTEMLEHWGSRTIAEAEAVVQLLQDAGSTDCLGSAHGQGVRELLESCLQQAAERARSRSTQASSSSVTTGLLSLGEETDSCSSSCTYPAAATDSGAVTIDW